MESSRCQRALTLRAAACALALALSTCSGCAPAREADDVARSLAIANGLAPEDVSVRRSAAKANYCEAVFRRIPADRMFRLTNEALRKEIPQAPLFVHVSVPGGDVTELFACPYLASVSHSGNEPISCGAVGNPMHPGGMRRIQLIDWTPEDLAAIAKAVDEHVVLDVAPRDGVFDWRAAQEFPFLSWQIRDATRWEGTDADLRLSVASLSVSGDSVVLSKGMICRRLFLDACDSIDFNGLRSEETRTLYFNAKAFDPAELVRFPRLEDVAIASRDPISCKIFSPLKGLFQIRIDGCRVYDCAALGELPLLYSAHFTNCNIDEDELDALRRIAKRIVRTAEDGILAYFR